MLYIEALGSSMDNTDKPFSVVILENDSVTDDTDKSVFCGYCLPINKFIPILPINLGFLTCKISHPHPQIRKKQPAGSPPSYPGLPFLFISTPPPPPTPYPDLCSLSIYTPPPPPPPHLTQVYVTSPAINPHTS